MGQYVFLSLCLILCDLSLKASNNAEDDWKIKKPRASSVGKLTAHIIEDYLPNDESYDESVKEIVGTISENDSSDLGKGLIDSQPNVLEDEEPAVDSQPNVLEDEAENGKVEPGWDRTDGNMSQHKSWESESERDQSKQHSKLPQYALIVPVAVAFGFWLFKNKN